MCGQRALGIHHKCGDDSLEDRPATKYCRDKKIGERLVSEGLGTRVVQVVKPKITIGHYSLRAFVVVDKDGDVAQLFEGRTSANVVVSAVKNFQESEHRRMIPATNFHLRG
jgi:hypothetical protein